MKQKRILHILGKVDEKYIEEASPEKQVKVTSTTIRPFGFNSKFKSRLAAMAACLCLVVTGLFGVNAYAMSMNEALLDVETALPEGLSMTIVDAAPDDAEFLIQNDTGFQVTYGKANRIEKFDGENWTEVTTESVGILPSTTVTMQSGEEMYGMCGWVTKRLILEAGTYRYLLVVDVEDPVNGNYPVVLKAEFEIK